MAKAKRISLFNLAFTLVIISVSAAILVGSVYKLTYEPIKEAKINKQLEAIRLVTGGDFDNNPFSEMIPVKISKNSQVELYPARKKGKITSMAIKSTTNKGFGGNITMMVGVSIDGYINGYEVLEQQETPGLGTKIQENKFKSQFIGLHPNKVKFSLKKNGGDIDAITAATISSNAAVDAIDKAYKAYKKFNSGN